MSDLNLEKSGFGIMRLEREHRSVELFEFERVAVELIVAGKQRRTAADASVTVFFYG